MDQDGPQNGTGVGDENDATLGLDEVVGTFEGVRPPAISGYRILDLLGKGGMGRVYLAEDLFLDRLVAIKVISDEIPRQEEPVAMFQREARAMAAIEHPNIVHIYAYGIEEDRPYFVMQYIEGQTLASRIGPGELWSMADAVRTGLNIVDALRAAWSQRIVHRDLKPANVLIDSEGIAHVADFGLAMAVQSSLEAGGMLTRRRFVGTPRYVAPEQAMGHDVDFRADFYSLGLMLYEMFVGETPFHGDTPHETMRLRFSENPPSVRERRPDLPIEIDRIVTWLTARNPDIRPSTHDSLFARLQELETVRSGSDGRGFSFSEVRAQTSGAALSSAHVEQRTSFTSFAPRTTQPLKAESHFIGRGQEVDRLGLRILEVLNGKGSIVSVVGPAGIGKSRLLLELNRQYSDRDLTFLKGQASAMGNTLAFHPLTDILRDWTKISSHDSNAEAVQKLESAIETLGDPRIRETLPFITRLMGLKLTGEPAERVALIEGQNLRRLIFNSLRSLIVAASSIRPLVLVFEDLHWADQTSLELLESLYGLAMNHSILFISLFRPGFDNTSGSFSELLKSSYGPFYDEITLQPLSPSECEDLFNNMTGKSKFSITFRQSIVEKCDGNPYFLEELVRSILDRAMEQTERGELTDGGRLEDLEVPETVQEVLHARIDRLDEDSREVIRIAAVAGRTVPFRVVQEIAGTNRDLEDRFLFLEDLGIVRRTEQHGQLSYTFRHALMQDVVYGSINHESRQLLHIKVAQAIEKVFSEREHEFFGMLAYHYTAAKDPVKSEKYLVKAGRLAQQSAASSEALRFFRRALDLYSSRVESQTDPHVLANLKKQVALALFDHGSYRESIDAFREILPSFGVNPPRSDSQLIAAFITSFIDFIFAIHFSRFRFNRKPSPSDSEAIGLYYKQLAAMAHHDAKRFFLESFVLARRLGVFDLKAVDNGVAMYVSAGNLLSWTGASFYLSNRVLTLVEDKIDASKPNEHISFEAAKITHAFLAGKWVDSSYNEQLVDDALGIGEIFLSSNYVIFHGRTALELGRLEDANRFAEELSRISVEYDHSYPAALHFYLHAKTLLKKRQLPEAILECNSGRQAAEVAALDTVLFGLAALKARALAFMGDLDDANEILQDIESNFDFSRLPKSYRGDYLISRCTVDVFRLDRSVLLENRDQSRRELKSARGSTDRLIRNSKKVASHRVEAQRLTGIVDWLSGNQQTALRKWKRGIALGERLHANLDLSRLYCEIGKRLQSIEGGRRGSPGEKSEFYLDHARSMFTEIGLDWDLDEITDSCHVHISR